ncbi:hypothetical protein FGO68_gene2864 [Halteria grandinella]|uniref:Secreted protein n=1 Tax=Halteria grandinella TaxID=5974 RepID=A0A8J8N9N2_HALGN|nr:hypothetical protein FGO68_gene2864 [Halteria grandinella]
MTMPSALLSHRLVKKCCSAMTLSLMLMASLRLSGSTICPTQSWPSVFLITNSSPPSAAASASSLRFFFSASEAQRAFSWAMRRSLSSITLSTVISLQRLYSFLYSLVDPLGKSPQFIKHKNTCCNYRASHSMEKYSSSAVSICLIVCVWREMLLKRRQAFSLSSCWRKLVKAYCRWSSGKLQKQFSRYWQSLPLLLIMLSQHNQSSTAFLLNMPLTSSISAGISLYSSAQALYMTAPYTQSSPRLYFLTST